MFLNVYKVHVTSNWNALRILNIFSLFCFFVAYLRRGTQQITKIYKKRTKFNSFSLVGVKILKNKTKPNALMNYGSKALRSQDFDFPLMYYGKYVQDDHVLQQRRVQGAELLDFMVRQKKKCTVM